MSQFCPKEDKGRRCVLGKNHFGGCSLQGKGSTTVRLIEKQEEIERKMEES